MQTCTIEYMRISANRKAVVVSTVLGARSKCECVRIDESTPCCIAVRTERRGRRLEQKGGQCQCKVHALANRIARSPLGQIVAAASKRQTVSWYNLRINISKSI